MCHQKFRVIFLLFSIICCSLNSYAQQRIRYVQTKYIDKEGEHGPSNLNSKVKMYEFTNNRITEKVGTITLQYAYHHRDGANSVYYLLAHDYISNQDVLNPNMVIVVSSDRSLINEISYNAYGVQGMSQGVWESTTVFRREDEQRYGHMVE